MNSLLLIDTHFAMGIFKIGFIILVLILALAMFVASQQEKLIFYPQKLHNDYQFSFSHKFQERFFQVDDKVKIHGLFFPAENPKGLIFYLHGNAGSNSSWGQIADVYLSNGYDFFILDYRGYGKSQGKISSEKQLHNDIQIVYDSLKSDYKEENIVVIGYSIGTGPAAHLAAKNNPKMLILKAPYYNLPDLAGKLVKFYPSFLIRYKFRTDKYLPQVKCPVVIFHGDVDEIIYAESAYKLQKLFKPKDKLIMLKNQTHNGINENPVFLRELKTLLSE